MGFLEIVGVLALFLIGVSLFPRASVCGLLIAVLALTGHATNEDHLLVLLIGVLAIPAFIADCLLLKELSS
jgi:hypothetical protein